MPKTILVTGGTGFIGKRVVVKLRERGYKVLVLGRRKITFHPGVKYIRGDLLNPRSFEEKIGKPDAVIHLAGNADINYSLEHPVAVFRENVLATLNLLEALRRRNLKPLVVFSSTDRIYGKTTKRVVSEKEHVFPIEPYVASKICSEILLQTYNHLCGIPYIVFRIDSGYGPGQPERMFVSNVIRKMVSGTEVTVGQLNVYKNFVYVDDIAEAILAALKAGNQARNTVYNVGGSHAPLKKVLLILKNIAERKLGRKIKIKFDRALVRKSGAEVRPFRLSVKKAEKNLRWKPRVSLEKGLLKTFDYFLKNAK